jgi:hypothetical protein
MKFITYIHWYNLKALGGDGANFVAGVMRSFAHRLLADELERAQLLESLAERIASINEKMGLPSGGYQAEIEYLGAERRITATVFGIATLHIVPLNDLPL